MVYSKYPRAWVGVRVSLQSCANGEDGLGPALPSMGTCGVCHRHRGQGGGGVGAGGGGHSSPAYHQCAHPR